MILKWALQRKGLVPVEKELIIKYVEEAKAPNKGLKLFERHAKAVRIEKAHEKSRCKIVLGLSVGTTTSQVMQNIDQPIPLQRGRTMPGQAPPGWFVDALQQWLQEVREESGDM